MNSALTKFKFLRLIEGVKLHTEIDLAYVKGITSRICAIKYI